MKGWDQRQLAAHAGVSVGAVSGIETGRTKPSPETMGKIATALGLPIRSVREFTRAAGLPERDHKNRLLRPKKAPKRDWSLTEDEAGDDGTILASLASAIVAGSQHESSVRKRAAG